MIDLCWCKGGHILILKIVKCDIIMFNEVIMKLVYSNNEISKVIHISYCFMGILQKQEREPHLSIRHFHGGFPKISQNFPKFPKISQNFPKFLKKTVFAGFYQNFLEKNR